MDRKLVREMTAGEMAARQQVTNRTDDFLSTYANHAALTLSPWDFRFTFGILRNATKEVIETEDRVEVFMSPPHAKAFLRTLREHIGLYESNFGPILDVNAPRNDQEDKATT